MNNQYDNLIMSINALREQILLLNRKINNITVPPKIEYFTAKQVAKLFNCSSSTIRRWIKERKIKAFKPNNGNQQDRYLIPKAEIENLILKSGGKTMKF